MLAKYRQLQILISEEKLIPMREGVAIENIFAQESPDSGNYFWAEKYFCIYFYHFLHHHNKKLRNYYKKGDNFNKYGAEME